jgi:hypothetical protein
MPRLKLLYLVLFPALAAGCSGGPKLAPVSGVVTLDGKPYPNAVVSFQPIGGKGNENPGRGSMGLTDANGRFELLYENVQKGAVVGKHNVRISTVPGKGSATPVDSELGSPDGVVLPKGAKPDMDYDLIPTEWNENSTKTFVVPAGGTDQANFDIVTKKSGKKDGKK